MHGAIARPETSNNSLSIAPRARARARGGESGTDDFLPALWALLLPGTALSTPVDVGADGSDGYCRVPAIAMMHHRG